MSGEAVGIPVLIIAPPIGAAVIGVGVVAATVLIPGSLAVRLVKTFVDDRVKTAEEEAAKEREETAEWRHHQAQQREAQERETRLFESFQEVAASLAKETLHDPTRNSESRANSPRSMPQRDANDAQPVELLTGLSELLDKLGDEFKAMPSSPYPVLKSYRDQLERRVRQGKRLYLEEVTAFRDLLNTTLRDCKATREKTAVRHAELTSRVRALLDKGLVDAQLAPTPFLQVAVRTFKIQLLEAIRSNSVSAGQLDVLERQRADLAAQIAQAVESVAFRKALSESVISHLTKIGYKVIDAFPESMDATPPVRARLQVPGGEEVFVTLHANGKIAFQLAHEVRGGLKIPFAEFLPGYRRQEARWCADLKQLFRQLVTDGFSYEISFEREVPEASIPLVTVETADDLMSESDYECARRQQLARHAKRRTQAP